MNDSVPEIETLTAKPNKPYGFNGLMAALWCFAYFVMMQVVAGVICGLPLLFIAVGMVKRNQPELDANGVSSSSAVVIATMLTLICSHLMGLFCGWLLLRVINGKTWPRKIALNRGPSATHYVLLGIGFPALMAMGTFIDPVVSRYLPKISDVLKSVGINYDFGGLEEMLSLFAATPWPLAILAVAVLPALNEELWCRGFLGHNLGARYAVWPTVFITSFLFGALHLDPRQGTAAALLGVAIHFAYLATRSIWVPIALHFANNAIAVIHLNRSLNVPILRPYEELLDRSPWMFFIGTVTLFGAICYALWQTRSKLIETNPIGQAWTLKSPSGAEVPPEGATVSIHQDPIEPVTVALVFCGAFTFAVIVAIC